MTFMHVAIVHAHEIFLVSSCIEAVVLILGVQLFTQSGPLAVQNVTAHPSKSVYQYHMALSWSLLYGH